MAVCTHVCVVFVRARVYVVCVRRVCMWVVVCVCVLFTLPVNLLRTEEGDRVGVGMGARWWAHDGRVLCCSRFS